MGRLRWVRSRAALIVVALIVVVGGVIAIVSATTGDPSVRKVYQGQAGVPEPDGRGVRLEANLYLPEHTPAPAVLLTPGFGSGADSLDGTARDFAKAGYVALAYTPRGFGRSGGKIHFASPSYEVADMKRMVDYLTTLDEVRKVDGDPQVAAAGSSYGGGLSLLLAAYDKRVDAVSADITWNNLEHAFFPNFGGSGAGPFKKLWVGQLFGNGFGDRQASGLGALLGNGRPSAAQPSGTPSCGRFAEDVCRAYQQSAAAGAPTSDLRALLATASPSSVLNRITVPTQLTQGEQDSLFPLSEADANARGISAHGTPVSVAWRAGGHDNQAAGGTVAIGNAISWFDKVFSGAKLGTQPFRFNDQNGSVNSDDSTPVPSTVQAAGYPGIDGTRRDTRTFTVAGGPQSIGSPAGGVPAVITSIPGLGGISSRFDQALSVLPTAPGQTAVFASPKLGSEFSIVGQPSVAITVTSQTATDAVLFAGLRDVDDGGSYTLPSQLVSPIRVTGLTPGQPRTVTVRLPSIVQKVAAGHRLVLTVSASDFAYGGPTDARTYTIGLAGNRATLTAPTAAGRTVSGGYPLAWLWTGIGACVLAGLLVGFVFYRRRQVLKPDPALFGVPVVIDGLVKEYAGGYRAVDDISFRVEKGQVVGLLGPNGAGKTTALRVLVGLITPTAGELYVFGQRIAPGAPVLSRLGSFIEGPGFLPHLTGRENLRLYWAATGRPDDEAEFDVALDIAGLGGSVDRKVRTYSQGMRQRLGIAQAMLGLPELLVLDEPTNGLDPPQIAEMREVMKQYAETGRTVVVSSHLLSEVEQTCTHVVVMHKGRVVSAGSVDEISGTDGAQLSVADPRQAAEILAANGVEADLVPARRSLEDVFLELIGEDQTP